MKKALSLFLALVMVLSLAACGGKNNADNAGKENAGTTQNDGQTADKSEPSTESGKQETSGDKMPEAEKKPEEEKKEEKPAEVAVTLSHTDVTLFSAGETFRLSPRGVIGTYTASFISADETIATVDSNGIVTAVSTGTTKVNVHVDGDGVQYDGSCIIRCNWKVEEKPAEQPDASKPEQTVPSDGADLAAFYSDVTGKYEMPMGLQLVADEAMLESFFPGLSDISLKQKVFGITMMGPMNAELILVEVENASDVDAVKAVLQNRLDSQIDGGAWYPETIEVWERYGRVVSRDNYVLLLVSASVESIEADFYAFVG